MKILVKKLHPNAIVPSKAHASDAAFDLHCLGGYVIGRHTRTIVRTGIAVAIPPGYYMQIAPRSGLAIKKGVMIMAGVVDAGYREEVGIVVYNSGSSDVRFEKGDRIAQALILPVPDASFEVVDELDTTDRAGGFGSTGA